MLRYLCVMTVIGLRVCASSTVMSSSRGVQRGLLLGRTGFQIQQKIRFFHRSSVSCAYFSGRVYLTPTDDAARSFASLGLCAA